MIYSTERKTETLNQLDKEIEELEAMAVEGEKPTQSPDDTKRESSPEVTDGTAEEQANLKPNEPVQDLEFWKNRALTAEKRFNVSKPKYDSNIFKLKQDNMVLKKVRVELLQQLNIARQNAKAVQKDPVDSLFNEETVDVLGKETANAIKKSIKDTNARINDQEARIEAKRIRDEKNMFEVEKKSEYSSFLSRLERIVPDQRSTNSDPRFVEYLKEPDEMTGEIRMDLLRNAEDSRDVGRVAQFFLDYKNSVGAPKNTPRDSINKHIAPTKGAGADSVTDNKPLGFTTADVDRIYNDVAKGKYRGRESEKIAILAQIDQAYLAGQIT